MERFSELLGADKSILEKYGGLLRFRGGYTYFLRHIVDDEIFHECFDIPEPVVLKSSRNIDDNNGWSSYIFLFLGRHLITSKRYFTSFEKGKELFSISDTNSLKKQLPLLMSFRDGYLEQIKRQASSWVEIQEEIASVLKVYYLECIKDEEDKFNPESWEYDVWTTVHDFFKYVRTNPSLESLDTSTLESFSGKLVSEHLQTATVNGVKYYLSRSNELINQTLDLTEPYYTAEYFIQVALLDSEELSEQRFKQINWHRDLPDPRGIAEDFIKEAKNRVYSIDAIADTMRRAKDKAIVVSKDMDELSLKGHLQDIINQSLEDFDHNDLIGEKTPHPNTIRNWIHAYCKEANISY